MHLLRMPAGTSAATLPNGQGCVTIAVCRAAGHGFDYPQPSKAKGGLKRRLKGLGDENSLAWRQGPGG